MLTTSFVPESGVMCRMPALVLMAYVGSVPPAVWSTQLVTVPAAVAADEHVTS